MTSATLQMARALSDRLTDDPAADGAWAPELRPIVLHIATRATWRVDGGNRSFESIASRAHAWPDTGCRYADAVRLARDYVEQVDEVRSPGEYGERVAAEFDDAVRLAPTVTVLASFETLDTTDLLRLRATSARVIGLRDQAAFADGAVCTPVEFFWHDLDHMRFMVREDLAVLGIEIPDAYGPPDAEGRRSTFDVETGRHRCILAAAVAPLGAHRIAHAQLMRRATRAVDTLITGLDKLDLAHATQGAAARLMLFEICHEKSFTPVPEVLRRELSHDAHIAKMRLKLARRFWGDVADPVLADHLEAARDLLMRLVDGLGEAA